MSEVNQTPDNGEEALKIEERPMPPPPEGVTDEDQIEGAHERWSECPLRDCKRDPELLYEDFYLRDIRKNRLMCSACVVRTEVGYMAREVVKESDDRFFDGTMTDYLIVAGVVTGLSAVVNALMFAVGFWLLAIFIGGAAGAGIAQTARRLTGGRIGRHSANVAVGATIAGGILSPVLYFGVAAGPLVAIGLLTNPLALLSLAFNLSVIICTVAMVGSIYSIFLRRI